jgi:pilus assembly protein TadC
MENKQVVQVVKSGFPLMSWLTVIFVIAKLFGKFPHSWFIVFAPLWVPWAALLAFILAGLIIGAIVALIAVAIDEISRRKRRRRNLKDFINRTSTGSRL